MFKIKALLLALAVFLVGPSVALAQPLADVATYANWSLTNSTNPFTGRKGITHEEATRLPVGTLIALHDGSTRALKRGETVWKFNRELALTAPLASRPIQPTAAAKAAPRAEKPQAIKAKPTPPVTVNRPTPAKEPIANAVDPYALEQARIHARAEAEQETARLAVEANNLRMAAESNLQLASGAADAAFAANRKSEAREQADAAKSVAEAARKNATDATGIAAAANEAARATDSVRARKNAAAAQTDAIATAAAATKAEGMAKQAATALDLWVVNWTPTIVLAVIAFLLIYTAITSLLFHFLPGVFNFLFKGGISNDGLLNIPVKLLAIPPLLASALIEREAFCKEHYAYLYAEPETAQETDVEEPWERDLHGTAKPEKPNHDDYYPIPHAVVYQGPRLRQPTVQQRRAIGVARGR